MSQNFDTQILYQEGFSRVHLRNRARRKPTVRVRDHLRKLKHEQSMRKPQLDAFDMDIYSVKKSFSALNHSGSQITQALDHVRKLQDETVHEKDSGTILRQNQVRKALRRLEVKEKKVG